MSVRSGDLRSVIAGRSTVSMLTLQVQHVVPEVTIPPEVTPENVTTSIVDTSCQSGQLRASHDRCQHADGGTDERSKPALKTASAISAVPSARYLPGV